jgi:signal peptide peptidase SppA
MSVLDILHSPWAILPSSMEEIKAIYDRHARGEAPDLAAIEARRGAPLAGPTQGYEVRDGVAIVPVRGVMAQRMNLVTDMSGGTSSEILTADIKRATADPKIKGIILAMDTPGGTVAGTQAAAKAAMAARAVKPILTLVEGQAASAGVWIGTAGQKVYLSSATDEMGSIGVAIQHIDRSAAYREAGMVKTDIFAGKYKRIATDHAPLSEPDKAVLQEQMDKLYSIFVDDVAAQLGVSADKVLSDMADGRMFIGADAISAGLAHGFATLDQLVAEVQDLAKWRSIPSGGSRAIISLPVVATGPPAAAHSSPVRSPMSSLPEQVAQWAIDNPDGASALRAQGAADERARLTPEHETALAKARQEGAAAERDRIAGVRSAGLPGHDALIERLAADGHTTPGEAALAVNAAERELLQSAATARGKEAPAPVPYASAADDGLERSSSGAVPSFIASNGDEEAIDKAARAHQAANPGASYLDALAIVTRRN